MVNIEKLKERLDKYLEAKKNYEEVKELQRKASAKGHVDGKWLDDISFVQQVVYQKAAGETNYHDSKALNKELSRLLKRELPKLREEAIQNLSDDLKLHSYEFSKYTEK